MWALLQICGVIDCLEHLGPLVCSSSSEYVLCWHWAVLPAYLRLPAPAPVFHLPPSPPPVLMQICGVIHCLEHPRPAACMQLLLPPDAALPDCLPACLPPPAACPCCHGFTPPPLLM
jgi:hypothetical protein